MSTQKPASIKFYGTQTLDKSAGRELPLPSLLRNTTRFGADEVDPLLADITFDQIYHLSSAMRDAGGAKPKSLETAKPELLALMAEDGTTIFIRSSALDDDPGGPLRVRIARLA